MAHGAARAMGAAVSARLRAQHFGMTDATAGVAFFYRETARKRLPETIGHALRPKQSKNRTRTQPPDLQHLANKTSLPHPFAPIFAPRYMPNGPARGILSGGERYPAARRKATNGGAKGHRRPTAMRPAHHRKGKKRRAARRQLRWNKHLKLSSVFTFCKYKYHRVSPVGPAPVQPFPREAHAIFGHRKRIIPFIIIIFARITVKTHT